MINLLPESEKKAIGREYKFRMAVAALSFSAASFLLLIIFLVPAYVGGIGVLKSAENSLKILNSSPSEKEKETMAAAIDLHEKLSVLKVGAPKISLSDSVSLIIEKKNSGVLLKSFAFEKKGETAKIDVVGSSKDRASLISFTDELKKTGKFAEVYSPVSNLVREKDIEFTLSIALSTKAK